MTAEDVERLTGVSRSTLSNYRQLAIPDGYVFDREPQGVTPGHPQILYTEDDIDLIRRIKDLKKDFTYSGVKRKLTMEMYGEEMDEDSNNKDEPPEDKEILLEVKDHDVVTTSINVAEVFDKRHRNVLRGIDNLTQKDKHNFEQMFYESSREDSYGREQPVILMNRDGFTLLAMGYTGEKALDFKLEYIQKFNEMEQQLSSPKNSYEIADPVKRAEAWIKEQREREELVAITTQQEQIIGELQPSADYTDTILKSPNLITITQVAKDYGMSGQAMNDLLSELGVQYKQSGQWLLYSQHQGKGYTHSETYRFALGEGFGSKMYTKWSQKGRLFLYELLKEDGILPLIEQTEEGE